MANEICKYCGATDNLDTCPFCGEVSCGMHSCVIYGDDEELWACDYCLDKMPDGGDLHWMECVTCKQESVKDGCPEYKRIEAEYERIMGPAFATWQDLVNAFPEAEFRVLYNDGAAAVYCVSKEHGLILAYRGDVEKLKGMDVFIPAEVLE